MLEIKNFLFGLTQLDANIINFIIFLFLSPSFSIPLNFISSQ